MVVIVWNLWGLASWHSPTRDDNLIRLATLGLIMVAAAHVLWRAKEKHM